MVPHLGQTSTKRHMICHSHENLHKYGRKTSNLENRHKSPKQPQKIRGTVGQYGADI
jgi:hypothetical protein